MNEIGPGMKTARMNGVRRPKAFSRRSARCLVTRRKSLEICFMLAGANSGGPASPHRVHRQWRSTFLPPSPRARNFEADRIINTFLVSTRCSVLEKRELPVNKGRILALDKTRDKWTLPGTTTIAIILFLLLLRPRRLLDRSPRGPYCSLSIYLFLSHDAS